MGRLRREKGTVVAKAVLSCYARDDGSVAACLPSWRRGDERLFLLLPGLVLDELLPFVRKTSQNIGDSAKTEMLEAISRIVENSLDAIEHGDQPLRLTPFPLVQDFPGTAAWPLIITIRLANKEKRFWASTRYPPKARTALISAPLGICWDWVFSTLADEPETATSLLTDLRRLCSDYRENDIPHDFFLTGIGRAPFRLWVSKDGEVSDIRKREVF